MSRRELVHVANAVKPWDSIVRLRDGKGRPVCPVALVEDEEREWIALETDASEYGRPVEWTDRLETMFRLIRGAKADAQTQFRETMKKNQKQGTPRGN